MLKIVGLISALLIVIAAAGVGTWASFNDVQTSTGNVITAGTLVLSPAETGSLALNGHGGGTMSASPSNFSNTADGHIDFSNVAPGESGQYVFTLQNTGTVDGSITFPSPTVSFTQASPTLNHAKTVAITNNPVNGILGLGEYLGVKAYWKTGADAGAAAGATANYIYGSASNFDIASGLASALTAYATTIPLSGTVTAGSNAVTIVYIDWTINSGLALHGTHYSNGTALTSSGGISGDNVIQGDSASITISFALTQK